MRFSKAVVKHRVLILIVALVLMIPSLFGLIGTRVNYDMLNYLRALLHHGQAYPPQL